jgi:hypothetical protein
MIHFTKIKWAGEEAILVTATENHNCRLPILILDKNDIERLNLEFKEQLGVE